MYIGPLQERADVNGQTWGEEGTQGFIFLPLVSLKTLLMRQCLLPGPAQVWGGAFLDPSPLFSDGFKFPHINTHRRRSSSNTDNLDAHSKTYDAGKVRTDTYTGRQEVGSMLYYIYTKQCVLEFGEKCRHF